MEHEHSFLDWLRAIGAKPGMWLGRPSISHLQTFIVGYQVGHSCKDDTMVLDGFEFWVYHRYRHGGSMHWAQVILEQTGGDETAAFRLFFDHFEEFLRERERVGTPALKARFMTMVEEMHRDDANAA